MNRNRRTPLLLFAAAWLHASALFPNSQAAEGNIDFSRDIRPILSDHCFACHGPDDHERKGRLRFDQRESATQPAKSGAIAIVPGKPDESELLHRVVTQDPDDLMPPAKTGKPLSPAQIELLRRWIAQGAEFREHWAFVPPKRPAIPTLTNATSTPTRGNEIDAFLQARLRQEGLTSSTEADRTTLARRVTLDLTGLPPSPDELDAFLADSSSTAYESLVDRLLDSPRYGERMAVDWLDAARYADTHGYHLDSGRDMTAWRDWVIRAFNDNKRFDAFTVEQLAGDLIPDATLDQKIASGFNRNHMINYEGGAIPEEYQYAYLVDRVNTTSTAWLGVSMACAQCHDHKYDPFSRADYYRLLAFFNNVPERGLDGNRGNAEPVLALPSPEQRQQLAALDANLQAAEQRLAEAAPRLDAAQRQWEILAQTHSTPTWTPRLPNAASSTVNTLFRHLDDQSLLVLGENPARDTYTLTFDALPPGTTALRLEVLPDPSLPNQGPGRAENGNFVLSRAQLLRGSEPITPPNVIASFSQNGYPVAAILDQDPNTGWAIDGGIGKPHHALFPLPEPHPGGPLTLKLDFHSRFANHAIGRLRLSTSSSPKPLDSVPLPANLQSILAKAPADRTPPEQDQLRKFFREQVSTEYRQLREPVTLARKQRDELQARIPTTMVMGELPKPRDTFIRLRGQYDQLGDKVSAGTPAALPPIPTGQPLNRLGLARWLVSPDQPLTARVIVNRYWQMFFGIGLVRTAEDFGSQGEWPSHPELLDWLATDFMENGWNLKRLHRQMLTSAAYRQSAKVPDDLRRKDPENRLLARGPRFRLQAEFIRDQALAISGLLNPVIGGKSVSPYQPPGLWEELSMREDSRNFSAQFFVQSQGADLYRRSMYTFWKRSSPPPQMSTFDAPDRETCTVRRPRTNTPLQALILLNDPTYVEASRKLAERLLRRTGSDAERLAHAFRLATARTPTDAERGVLLRMLEEQRAHYRTRRDAAEKLLTHGDSPHDPTLDPSELAAWTMLSSAILNLDETLTRG